MIMPQFEEQFFPELSEVADIGNSDIDTLSELCQNVIARLLWLRDIVDRNGYTMTSNLELTMLDWCIEDVEAVRYMAMRVLEENIN